MDDRSSYIPAVRLNKTVDNFVAESDGLSHYSPEVADYRASTFLDIVWSILSSGERELVLRRQVIELLSDHEVRQGVRDYRATSPVLRGVRRAVASDNLGMAYTLLRAHFIPQTVRQIIGGGPRAGSTGHRINAAARPRD